LDKAGWISVLHLSDMWQMQLLRQDALTHLHPIANDVEKLELADKYDIPHWVLPALVALVNRDGALGIEESGKIGWVRAIKIAGLRERRLRVVPPYQKVVGDGRVITYSCDCGYDTRETRRRAESCRTCSASGRVALWTIRRPCSCDTLACTRCLQTGAAVASTNILTANEIKEEFDLSEYPVEKKASEGEPILIVD
jgi:hypothetical protein